jgi:hypothetical protein
MRRQGTLEWLNEVTDEQYKSYSREQVQMILKQRYLAMSTAARTWQNPARYPVWWARESQHLCDWTACSKCYPYVEERDMLSLNAIANGDIAPTALYGLGLANPGQQRQHRNASSLLSKVRPKRKVFDGPWNVPKVRPLVRGVSPATLWWIGGMGRRPPRKPQRHIKARKRRYIYLQVKTPDTSRASYRPDKLSSIAENM